MEVDPVTAEIVRNALIRIAEDMTITVERSAYSTIISEVLDFSCAIYDDAPNLLAQKDYIPIFLAAMEYAIKDTYKVIGRENLEPGDIIFCNDSYVGGGTHLPDVTCLAPVFYEEDVIGFAAARAHTNDVGGMLPGGWYNNTTEIFQEGVRYPPIKLYRRGEPDKDLFRVIVANSRTPVSTQGDIKALLATCRLGAQRFFDLVTKYGKERFDSCIKSIMAHSERIARAEVEKIPSGTYSGMYYVDGDGDDGEPLDERMQIKVAIKVDGSNMTVDLNGSSPQSKGPMNTVVTTTISAVRLGFKTLTTPFVPNNEGCFKPLDVVVPNDSILNPKPPAATSLLWEPVMQIPDLMMRILAPIMPEKVRAAHYGSFLADTTYGVDPQSKKWYQFIEPSVPGGWGAKPFEDGETMICTFDGDTRIVPVETLEAKYPLLVDHYGFIPDSAGPGKYRGGFGVRRDVRVLGHKPGFVVTFEHSKYTPPWGVFGGEPGTVSIAVVYKNEGEVSLHRKATGLHLEPNEVMSYRSAGGGGYGDPLERPTELVQRDVENGLISVGVAREQYGVVVDPVSHKIDRASTTKLREEARTKSRPITGNSEYWCEECKMVVDIEVYSERDDQAVMSRYKCYESGHTLFTRRASL